MFWNHKTSSVKNEKWSRKVKAFVKQEKEIRGILAFFFQSIKFKQPVNGQ